MNMQQGANAMGGPAGMGAQHLGGQMAGMAAQMGAQGVGAPAPAGHALGHMTPHAAAQQQQQQLLLQQQSKSLILFPFIPAQAVETNTRFNPARGQVLPAAILCFPSVQVGLSESRKLGVALCTSMLMLSIFVTR